MDVLDRIPLEVLLALQEAMVTPTEEGAERARKRAEEAGYYLIVMAGGRKGALDPLPMDEAPDDVEAVTLRFGGRGESG